MCLGFNWLIHVLLNEHCHVKMWSILHITSLFAYATAFSSLLKRSVPDESTPAREFEGMCTQCEKNNFEIVQLCSEMAMSIMKYETSPMVSQKSNIHCKILISTKSTFDSVESNANLGLNKWNEHILLNTVMNFIIHFQNKLTGTVVRMKYSDFGVFTNLFQYHLFCIFEAPFIIQKIIWRSEYTVNIPRKMRFHWRYFSTCYKISL